MTKEQIRQAIMALHNECARRPIGDHCVECPYKEECNAIFPEDEYLLAESPDEWKIPVGWAEPAEQEG